MIAFAEQNKDRWETYIVKPASVLLCQGDGLKSMFSVFGSVRVNELAAAMIDIVSHGSKEQTFLNAEIVSAGKAALARAGSSSTSS
jgi:hypothetical protein